ncbi:MAG: type II toxin-antitoxin system RelE/ParE family toxin [Nitrospirae bacterium]|nr:type II toxin-antitoxin system RelE/ParE family toxin [Magnetococcales bacterium]
MGLKIRGQRVSCSILPILPILVEGQQVQPIKKLHGYPLEEIRVKQPRTLHRVIIHVQLRDKILVLHGFTKVEGQETPKKELEQALARYQAMTATHGESKRHE